MIVLITNNFSNNNDNNNNDNNCNNNSKVENKKIKRGLLQKKDKNENVEKYRIDKWTK